MTTIDTNNGNVVMSKSVADSLDLKEGDSFTLKSGTNTFEFTLNEIVNTAITKGVFLHTDQFGDDIYGTSSAWIKADNVTEALLDKIDRCERHCSGQRRTGIMGQCRGKSLVH